ncbi:MAG TPA: tripartite tricarboxylate transporter substrate binding protein [Pseudolabrys sp.]|jgi:tripartite-type tricarboxylate transporter receptor subunit TctC|nr:tripartite tricarboxylate transporter substrate binding protein [Pseudolabrys sp.]
MRHLRISFAALAAIAVTTTAAMAASTDWPTRPIRMLVGFGAGGGTDIVTRIVSDPLSKLLGQPIVVENKPGAGGSIASDAVAKAAKDGYTATMISTGHTVGAAMMKSLPYDPVKDFAAVGQVANSCFVVVARKDFPANDLKGLIKLAKAEPGKFKSGTVGVGSTQHLAASLLEQMAGIKATHVPYRTTPAVVLALRHKEIDYAVDLVHAVIGQVNAGELKLIASGGPKRCASIPNVPTIAESGLPGYSVVGWYGIAFPAGTPKPIIDKMSGALKQVLARDDIREKLAKVGAEVDFSTPEEFAKTIESDTARWKMVRDKAGLQPR